MLDCERDWGRGQEVAGLAGELTEAVPLVDEGDLNRRPRRLGVMRVVRVVVPRVNVVPQVNQVHRSRETGVRAAHDQDPGGRGASGAVDRHVYVGRRRRVSAELLLGRVRRHLESRGVSADRGGEGLDALRGEESDVSSGGGDGGLEGPG